MRFTLFIDNLGNAKNFKIKDFCMEMKGKKHDFDYSYHGCISHTVFACLVYLSNYKSLYRSWNERRNIDNINSRIWNELI